MLCIGYVGNGENSDETGLHAKTNWLHVHFFQFYSLCESVM